MKFTLRGTVTEMGAEYVLDAGMRFTGMTFHYRGDSYLVGLPVEYLRQVPLYGEVTLTIRAGEPAPRVVPIPGADARDAARYRRLRESPEFNRDAGRLEWYLPRIGRDRVRGEPAPTLGERLDASVDLELEQLAAASRLEAVADQGFDDDDGGDEE